MKALPELVQPSSIQNYSYPKKGKGNFLIPVYFRLRSTSATAMAAMMMAAAAPAISKVSVDIPVPGVGATVGEADIVAVGVDVGATVMVGAIVGVIAALAGQTVK